MPNSVYRTWATSLASGVRIYNNGINIDGNGDAVEAITDVIVNARCPGKAAGVHDSLIRCWTVCWRSSSFNPLWRVSSKQLGS